MSQWGHDFRPDYLQLSMLHERWPEVPRIALTATATEQTHAEIAQRLQLGDARHFVASFDRPNIQYRIAPKDKPRDQLLNLLRTEHEGDAGIVYCLSRNSVEQTAQFLVEHGVTALPYHAGLDRQVRARNQSRFLREDGVVMVATIAFGMGIDKPDVRFVAHLDLPKSVEGYYQETGRAGRDGLPSTAWLAYGLADVVQQRRMIDTSEGDAAHKRRLTAHLDAMLALCETVVVPPGAAAQLLRPGVAALRQLRHVPDAARVVGRDGRGAEAAVDGGPAGAARAAVRRRAPGRHPARQGDAADHAARPRVAQHVRRRARTCPTASGAGSSGSCWRWSCSASTPTATAPCGSRPTARTVLRGEREVRLRRETEKVVRSRGYARQPGPPRRRPVRRRRRAVRGAAGVARGRREGAGRARVRGVPRRDAARGRDAAADVAGGARRHQRDRRGQAGAARPGTAGGAGRGGRAGRRQRWSSSSCHPHGHALGPGEHRAARREPHRSRRTPRGRRQDSCLDHNPGANGLASRSLRAFPARTTGAAARGPRRRARTGPSTGMPGATAGIGSAATGPGDRPSRAPPVICADDVA